MPLEIQSAHFLILECTISAGNTLRIGVADLHMAQLMPLPLTVSCCGKIEIGCPGKEAVKWL